MAEQGDVLTDLDLDPAPNGADNQPSAGIIAQYVKDMSVEVPHAPECFQWKDSPQVDVQFNIAARQVENEIHEVELKIVATAHAEQGKAFIVELAYCGLLGMRNLPEDQAHAFLYAEAPRILFPFARRILSDATRDAGQQPLLIDPIDFNGLYMQRLEAKKQEEAAAAGAPPVGNA